MNYLSWLIYMADVSNTINWLCYLAILPIIGWAIFEIARFDFDQSARMSVVKPEDLSDWYRRRNNAYSGTRDELDKEMEQRLQQLVESKAIELVATPKTKQITLKNVLFKPVATMLAVLALAITVPSPITLYAIAASEVGEQVVTSRTGQLAVDALNRWLAKQAK